MSAAFTAPLKSRVRSHSALLPAVLVAEGLRPALPFNDPSSITEGWNCITKGLGEAVTFGELPLPITREGVLVAEIVELELRGDDWWGRVETRGENNEARQRELQDRMLFGVSAHRVDVGPQGVSIDRVEPVDASATYTTTAPSVPGDHKVVRFDTERGWSEETRRHAEAIRGPRQPGEQTTTPPAWAPPKPEPPKRNRKQRRTEQALARRGRA